MEIAEKYRANIIKEYGSWTLFLHPDQRPIGRCYAWWKDFKPHQGERMPIDAIPPDAWLELQKISRDVTHACAALGYKTAPNGENFLLNMEHLANEVVHNHHMHIHFMPRTNIEFHIPEINVWVRRQWGERYVKPEEPPLPSRTFKIVKRMMLDGIA